MLQSICLDSLPISSRHPAGSCAAQIPRSMSSTVECIGTFQNTYKEFNENNVSNAAFSFDAVQFNTTMNTTFFIDYADAPSFNRFIMLVDEHIQTQGFVVGLIAYYIVLGSVALCISVIIHILLIRSGVQTTTGLILHAGNTCCKIRLLRTGYLESIFLILLLELLVHSPHIVVVVFTIHIIALTGWAWAGLLCLSFGLSLTLTISASAIAFGGKCHCSPAQNKRIFYLLFLGLACILITWVGQVSSLMRGFYTFAAMALTISAIPLIVAVYVLANHRVSHDSNIYSLGNYKHYRSLIGVRSDYVDAHKSSKQSPRKSSETKEGRVGGIQINDAQDKAYHKSASTTLAVNQAEGKLNNPLMPSQSSVSMSAFSTVSTLINPYLGAERVTNLVDNERMKARFSNKLRDKGEATSKLSMTACSKCAIQCNSCCGQVYLCLCFCCCGNPGKKKYEQNQPLGLGINAFFYLASALIMLGYSTIVAQNASPGWSAFGYYTSVMTLALDISALSAFHIGIITSPAVSTLCLVANRCLTLLANGGTVMLVETLGFGAYGLLFCYSTVDMRMGISTYFSGRRDSHHKRRDACTFVTTQEAVLGFLLFAYVGSYVSKGQGSALDIISQTGCARGRSAVEEESRTHISLEVNNRTFLLYCGIVVIIVAGFMRAACWMIHVKNNADMHLQRSLHRFQSMMSPSTQNSIQTSARNDAPLHPIATIPKVNSASNSDERALGTFLCGILFALIAEMMVVLSLLLMQIFYPDNLSVDVEITLIFVWPIFLCARSGIQRWVWLDFPENDRIVWAYLSVTGALLLAYALVGGIFGSVNLWCPILAFFTFEVLGFVIPIVEMGGRAISTTKQLSRFAFAWLMTAIIAHISAHILMIVVVILNLKRNSSNSESTITFNSTDDLFKTSAGFKYNIFFWVVSLSGTFIVIPSILVAVLVIVRIFELGLFTSHTNYDIYMSNLHKRAKSEIFVMVSMIARSQFIVILWMILLCIYTPSIGSWTIAVYIIFACAVVHISTYMLPNGIFVQSTQTKNISANAPKNPLVLFGSLYFCSRKCNLRSRAGNIGAIVVALIPLIPLVVSIIFETRNHNNLPGSLNIYGPIISAVITVNLMHWIWGRGLYTVISLMRNDVDLWCTPTIFPVYMWDASKGEHGELIESNAGLIHAFVAIGEIILVCLLGIVFAKPQQFYALVATSNFFVVLSVALIMELPRRPMLKYFKDVERLGNAMALMANQSINDDDIKEMDKSSMKCDTQGQTEIEKATEIATESLMGSTLEWASTCAAQAELRFQEYEQLILVAQSHSKLRELLKEQEYKEVDMLEKCFVTSEGIRHAIKYVIDSGNQRPCCSQNNIKQESSFFCKEETSSAASKKIHPPKGSAFLVTSKREKLMHLHSSMNVLQIQNKMVESSVEFTKRGSGISDKIASTKFGDSTHYVSTNDTFIPVLAMVEADMINSIVTIYGSQAITIQLVERQLSGSADIWMENCPYSSKVSNLTKLLLSKFRKQVKINEKIEKKTVEPLRSCRSSNHNILKYDSGELADAKESKLDTTSVETLYRAFGNPTFLPNKESQSHVWLFFVGDLGCTFDDWHQHSLEFLNDLVELRDAISDEYNITNTSMDASALTHENHEHCTKEECLSDEAAIIVHKQQETEVDLFPGSTSKSSILESNLVDQQENKDDNYRYSDLPDLEMLLRTTTISEKKYEMHKRLLVGQASSHFVRRAEALFESFLNWCSLEGNVDTVVQHQCSWLLSPFIALHHSGDKLHNSAATNAAPRLHKICFREVMRWSKLTGSKLQQMYKLQRVLFADFCKQKLEEETTIEAAHEHNIEMATLMELRREKSNLFKRAARFIWRDYPNLLDASTKRIDNRVACRERAVDVDRNIPHETLCNSRDSDTKLNEPSQSPSEIRIQKSEVEDMNISLSAKFLDHSFEGSRAIFVNPVDPSSTLSGKELVNEIIYALAQFKSNRTETEFSRLQEQHKESIHNRYVSELFSSERDTTSSTFFSRNHHVSVVWARPEEFMESPVLSYGFAADDIKQGILGDCWLLSAMSAVAHSHGKILSKYALGIHLPEKGAPSESQEIWPANRNGRYDIRIYVGGAWKVITVDDRIPCFKFPKWPSDPKQSTKAPSKTLDTHDSENEYVLQPLFGRSSTRNELWVSLLEKAIAKYYGSYEAITGGLVHVAMSLLTGGIGQMIRLPQAKRLGHVDNGRLWLKMFKLYQEGHLLAAGTPSGSKGSSTGSTTVSQMGIVQGHAYAILKLVQVRDMRGQHKLIQLRNPWGKSRSNAEWQGAWNDKDSQNWTQRTKAKAGFTAGQDGIFWMSFEDFVEIFQNLYICRLYSQDLELPTSRLQKGWRRYICPGSWTKTAGLFTAGGAPTRQNQKAFCNPQFLLKPSHPNTSVFITLEQPTLYHARHICIFVARVGGKRFGRIRSRTLVTDSTPFSNSGLVSCEIPNLSNATRLDEEARNRKIDLQTSSSLSRIAKKSMSNFYADQNTESEGLTVMVCCYDEGEVGHFELAVYSNYPLVAATYENCGEGMPGESLPYLGPGVPVWSVPQPAA